MLFVISLLVVLYDEVLLVAEDLAHLLERFSFVKVVNILIE